MVLVVVGLRKMLISSWDVFLMIDKSRKLIWSLASSVGLSCRLQCYGVRVGAGGIVNYEDVMHVSCLEGYVFGIQERFYVVWFQVLQE